MEHEHKHQREQMPRVTGILHVVEAPLAKAASSEDLKSELTPQQAQALAEKLMGEKDDI